MKRGAGEEGAGTDGQQAYPSYSKKQKTTPATVGGGRRKRNSAPNKMGGPDAQSVEPLNLSLYKASFDKLQKQVCDVLIEVEHQKQTIKDLSSRLSTVVSVIEGGSVAELTAAAVNDFAAAIKRPAAVVAADHAVQHSVVAAMYVDNQRRQNRATNFILSGLPVSNTRPDQNAVADLCRREFREDPDIVHCKRLGKLSPNRIQPLLVVLKTAAQAVRFISLAKKLRQSTDPVTKNGIYIAANLTKAEAQAAYVVRCERRQAAARKQQRLQQQQHQPPAVHGTSATVTVRSGSPPVQNRPSPPTTQNSLQHRAAAVTSTGAAAGSTEATHCARGWWSS